MALRDADEELLDFPAVYSAGRDGWAVADLADEAGPAALLEAVADCTSMFEEPEIEPSTMIKDIKMGDVVDFRFNV